MQTLFSNIMIGKHSLSNTYLRVCSLYIYIYIGHSFDMILAETKWNTQNETKMILPRPII